MADQKPLTKLHELVQWKPEQPDIDKHLAAYQGDPKPETLQPLLNTLQPTIDKAVQTYAPNASPIVHGRAKLLAVRAIKKYVPTRGANLHTHVFRQLQELQRLAPKIDEPLPLPERMRRERGMLLKAVDDAKNDLGREPTDEEVSQRSGLPPAKITKIRNLARTGLPSSVLEESGEDDEEAPDVVAHQRDPEEDWQDAVYHDLGPIDQLILQHRTGYRGADVLPNQEIAKLLKISPAAVSQRAAKIQARLDEFYA